MNDAQHQQMVRRLADQLETIQHTKAKIITTHISSIILCGNHAYKLKRPVKLPFVDFSTLEKRHFYCLEELRVNQQTAPDLYLSVLAITGTFDQPRIGNDGACLDYAVQMHRFEDGALLSERLASQRLDQQDIDGLAQNVAAAHAVAAKATEVSLTGCTPTIEWLNESLQEIANSAWAARATPFKTVERCVSAEHERIKLLDQTRRANGFYRECHGDLHLANIIRTKNRIMAFDALEFEPSLRLIDVINDVAFPFMDLLAHDQAPLAWRLINGWCEASGDYNGLAVLKFYTLYRALVRAKVAVLSANDENAERYWRLAKTLCLPTEAAAAPRPITHTRPKIVVVCGLSGSGKSTVAQRLVEKIGAIRLRADVERKRIFSATLDQPETLYRESASQETYGRLMALAHHLHLQGLNVIVDATFLDQARIDDFTAFFLHLPAQTIQVVLCRASVQAMRSRIELRGQLAQDPSDATPAVLEKQLARASDRAPQWPVTIYELDNDGTIAELELKTDRLALEILLSK